MRNRHRSNGRAMYIKATRTHTDKAGEPVRSHRLVLAQRVGDKVRHRTLLNLGTDYPVPREKWKAVTDLAEALLHGRPPLFEGEADVQAAAEDIVAKLRARGFRADAMLEEARKPDIATVDLDTLEHENPRSVGCERLCLQGPRRPRLRRNPPRPRHQGSRRAHRQRADRRQDGPSRQRA